LVHAIYGQVFVPPAVVAELAIAAEGIGAFLVVDFPFLVARRPSDPERVRDLAKQVDRGEAEALALAIELRADAVLMDEAIGRKVAKSLGIRSVGVLALLVEAKSRGLVTQINPLINELDARIHFRLSAELRRRVLEDAGE
jgi:uncharacterized protein